MRTSQGNNDFNFGANQKSFVEHEQYRLSPERIIRRPTRQQSKDEIISPHKFKLPSDRQQSTKLFTQRMQTKSESKMSPYHVVQKKQTIRTIERNQLPNITRA